MDKHRDKIRDRTQLGCLLAKHGQVDLADDKGEDEVDADGDGLPSSSGLDVVELRRHQPSQRAPGPGKSSSVQALKGQNSGCRLPGNEAGDLVKAAAHDSSHNNEADEHLEATLSKQHLAAQPVSEIAMLAGSSGNIRSGQSKEVTAMLALHRLHYKSCTDCNAQSVKRPLHSQVQWKSAVSSVTHSELASRYGLKAQHVPVNQHDGQNGGAHIDGTHNGSVKESRVGTVTQHVKQLSGVEHDGVDTGELLEEGNQDSSSLHGRARNVSTMFLNHSDIR